MADERERKGGKGWMTGDAPELLRFMQQLDWNRYHSVREQMLPTLCSDLKLLQIPEDDPGTRHEGVQIQELALFT
jgi:hypothetical protein